MKVGFSLTCRPVRGRVTGEGGLILSRQLTLRSFAWLTLYTFVLGFALRFVLDFALVFIPILVLVFALVFFSGFFPLFLLCHKQKKNKKTTTKKSMSICFSLSLAFLLLQATLLYYFISVKTLVISHYILSNLLNKIIL
ncbi:hypothetical protein EDC96DRAFT_163799 [Choanephora cucurbitarum]|nr:hypothetical protein EDC96DRAFT_163799 [Choanephora cucurbitarum]